MARPSGNARCAPSAGTDKKGGDVEESNVTLVLQREGEPGESLPVDLLRGDIQDALNGADGEPSHLLLDIEARRIEGDTTPTHKTVALSFDIADLERLLEETDGDRVRLSIDGEKLHDALLDPDVEAHGMREKLVVFATVAAMATGGAAVAPASPLHSGDLPSGTSRRRRRATCRRTPSRRPSRVPRSGPPPATCRLIPSWHPCPAPAAPPRSPATCPPTRRRPRWPEPVALARSSATCRATRSSHPRPERRARARWLGTCRPTPRQPSRRPPQAPPPWHATCPPTRRRPRSRRRKRGHRPPPPRARLSRPPRP